MNLCFILHTAPRHTQENTCVKTIWNCAHMYTIRSHAILRDHLCPIQHWNLCLYTTEWLSTILQEHICVDAIKLSASIQHGHKSWQHSKVCVKIKKTVDLQDSRRLYICVATTWTFPSVAQFFFPGYFPYWLIECLWARQPQRVTSWLLTCFKMTQVYSPTRVIATL